MNSKLLTLVLALFGLTAFGQQKPNYTDTEAAAHIGEEATVTGKLATVANRNGMIYLNFGDRFPNQTFTGVVFSRNVEAVGDVAQYEGKDVSISGKIEASPKDQKPQIILNSASQIKLAGAAPMPAKPGAAPAPAATAPMPATPSATPSLADRIAGEKPKAKVTLATNWIGNREGGEMTRKDLAKLFGASGSASENAVVENPIEVYPGLPFLTSLATAQKILHLGSPETSRTRIFTAGVPQSSFASSTYDGVFPGGFTKLHLITDNSDQVVSVLLVDSNTQSRVPNEPDTTGYHTFNFITGHVRGTNDIFVKHVIVPDVTLPGVVVVDSLLVDPTAPENIAPPPRSRSSKSKTTSTTNIYSKTKTGKVLERTRWFVPTPVVNLILRCVVQ